MHAVAGSKKIDILKQLEDACKEAGVELVLHVKPKKEDGVPQMEELITAIKGTSDSPTVGTLTKVRLHITHKLVI